MIPYLLLSASMFTASYAIPQMEILEWQGETIFYPIGFFLRAYFFESVKKISNPDNESSDSLIYVSIIAGVTLFIYLPIFGSWSGFGLSLLSMFLLLIGTVETIRSQR
jgi:hypothetical protein